MFCSLLPSLGRYATKFTSGRASRHCCEIRYRPSTRIEQRPLVPFREGRISEPGIEYLQRILGRIGEYDAHADSVV
jgi:hypothetical protein